MLKKIIISIILLLCFTSGNTMAVVFNKNTVFSKEDIAYFNSLAWQYGALTKQDVENYIKIGKDLNKAFRKSDRLEAAKIMQQVGWKYDQGHYFDIKIKNGYWLLEEGADFAYWLEQTEFPAALVPNKNELDIIERYKGKLSRIVD